MNIGGLVKRAAEWLRDRAELLVCHDLRATKVNELRYVPELRKMFRDAPKSGLLISTRDRAIAGAASSSPVNLQCVEQLGTRAKKILGKAAFGDNCEEIISN